MHSIIVAAFLEISRVPVSMGAAAILVFLIGLWAARTDLAEAGGLDKVVALGNLCFALPLAAFGALHLSDARSLMPMVPSYMPWHLFWTYFFGFALLSASLSIATKIQVRWSGLLFGVAMFLIAAMLIIPGTLFRGRRLDPRRGCAPRAKARARRGRAHYYGPDTGRVRRDSLWF
jgi:hypothetical protein